MRIFNSSRMFRVARGPALLFSGILISNLLTGCQKPDENPPVISYTTPIICVVGTAMIPDTPKVSGTVSGYSVSPALPAGLSLDAMTGIISGIPITALAAADYTVTATNGGGSTTAVVNITVNAGAPSNLSYATPLVCTVGSTLSPEGPSVTGTVTHYSVSPALPTGLLLNATTGVVSGTPTEAWAAADYTITATNGGGSTTAVLRITVKVMAPIFVYKQNNILVVTGAAMNPDTAVSTGGPIAGYSVSPALPAGLYLSAATGILSGVPTSAARSVDYVITASGPGGTGTTIIHLGVFPVHYADIVFLMDNAGNMQWGSPHFCTYPGDPTFARDDMIRHGMDAERSFASKATAGFISFKGPDTSGIQTSRVQSSLEISQSNPTGAANLAALQSKVIADSGLRPLDTCNRSTPINLDWYPSFNLALSWLADTTHTKSENHAIVIVSDGGVSDYESKIKPLAMAGKMPPVYGVDLGVALDDIGQPNQASSQLQELTNLTHGKFYRISPAAIATMDSIISKIVNNTGGN